MRYRSRRCRAARPSSRSARAWPTPAAAPSPVADAVEHGGVHRQRLDRGRLRAREGGVKRRAQRRAEVPEQLVVARDQDELVEAQVGGDVPIGIARRRSPPSRRTPPRARRSPPRWRARRRAPRPPARSAGAARRRRRRTRRPARPRAPGEHVRVHEIPEGAVATCVPVFGRETTRPLAARTLIASRSTVRLTAGRHRCRPPWEAGRRAQFAAQDAQPDVVHELTVQPTTRVRAPFRHTITI